MMVLCTCSEAGLVVSVDSPTQARPSEQTLVEIDKIPLVGETPQQILQSWLTPNPLFFVRNHFNTPDIKISSWILTVDGHVSNPRQFLFDDIKKLPKYTSTITLECAGNNRSDLEPSTPGNQFQTGAVSTGVWAGARLSDVLDAVGIESDACQVLFQGADSGEPAPNKPMMSYLRSLPMDVAMHQGTLIAYEMNGEELPTHHGYPLRLVVPGWYGMASVKWLIGIKVIDYDYQGFFQTEKYVIKNSDGIPEQITQMSVKSLISDPAERALLPKEPTCVSGMAWSGYTGIEKVEFSADGGRNWDQTNLSPPSGPYAWQQWHIKWVPLQLGHYTLLSKATDESGHVQPMETLWNSGGYIVNGVRPICVTVG